MAKIMVSIQDICKMFPMKDTTLTVLDNVSLDIHAEEFVCLLGYSGCGKSTMLRIVAGLETADSGEILVDGQPHTGPNRDTLLLFQDFNQLFPWKTVLDNVMYPMLATKLVTNKAEAKARAEELLDSVGLADFKYSYPHQLSGGMKQRAAVARALALKPKVLLMDEPFAALDAITRTNLQALLRKICEDHHLTVLFVTHSVEEAVLLSDRIVIMSNKTHKIEHDVINRAFNASAELRAAQRLEVLALLNERESEEKS